MGKADIPGVRCKSAKGRDYWYFEANGRRVRLPDPADVSFPGALASARRGEPATPSADRSFRRLITLYRASPRFTKLAPRTRRDYGRVLVWALEGFGQLRPEAMRRQHVARAMQANAHRERFANSIKEVLSVLFEFAIEIGWLLHNPARGIRRLKTERPPLHRPWPVEAVDRFCAVAGPTERTILELAIGTGQRISDVLRMRWGDIVAGGIEVRQSKTGAILWIPFTKRLAAHLAEVPRTSLTIAAGRAGRPLSYDAAAKRIRRVRTASGCRAWTIHGWRYTAAEQIATGGGSDEELRAITGHRTGQMLDLYAGPARQKARAVSAQARRESP